jgi:hypothetical protein
VIDIVFKITCEWQITIEKKKKKKILLVFLEKLLYSNRLCD